jgi:cell wall-associated NlpC family hydrolase
VSDRDAARHRAPQRFSTPLDSLAESLGGRLAAVTEQLGSTGRSGAVLAVSTGLVATMGLPANAVTKTAPENGASLSRPAAVSAGSVTLPASVVSGAAFSSPATATVSFERQAFTVRKAAAPSSSSPRIQERASRTQPRSTAKAGTTTGGTGHAAPQVKGTSVLSIARSLIGTPYVYGGTTTAGFDCSGFTRYVFRRVGVSLPRTSSAQYGAVRHISRSQATAGDLVFILTGGGISHVGIVTRPGYMIDSPRSGKSVTERAIWSSNALYGRP